MARRLAFLVNSDLPCRLFEDEHLLVVNKPPGLNTHAPSPFAGEGIYDWLRHREPRWSGLAIIHRLDKETSGVLVFAKTPLACKELTAQFTAHEIRKEYLLATDRPAKGGAFTVKSSLRRQGERYVSLPVNTQDPVAETRFEPMVWPVGLAVADSFRNDSSPGGGTRPTGPVRGVGRVPSPGGEFAIATRRAWHLWRAKPLTGRTHQIRVHAAARGLPILGDVLYGGSPAARLWLHAERIQLRHPATHESMEFVAPVDFNTAPGIVLRRALIAPAETTACRWVHGAADGQAGCYVEQWGNHWLVQSEGEMPADWSLRLEPMRPRGQGVYHKSLNRQVRRESPGDNNPQRVDGSEAPAEFEILENGVKFAIRFGEGYSTGLFLDQRDNRRRLLMNHVGKDFPLRPGGLAGAEVLNAFAYTCGFSVCAAQAGARVASIDLSRKYLEWGRHNFALNGLDPAGHEFLAGDVFDWLKRLRKKGRQFAVVLLDPPTFSSSRQSGTFQARRDYAKLVEAAAPLVAPRGVLFCSTNAAQFAPEEFLAAIQRGLASSGRGIARQLYIPQPPDFPVNRAEPAYLKTAWTQLS